jgi:hypothetical protein
MKTASLAQLFATVALALLPAAAVSPPGAAVGTTFFCGASNGIPATIARTSGGEVPLILWDSPDIGDSGDTRQKLCEDVSQKFQNYYDSGTLNYITTGKRDGQVVACAAQGAGEPCSGVLFPLKPDERNPKSALQRILRIRVPADGPISETDTRVYINLDKYLNGKYPSLDLTGTRTPSSQSENSPQ